MTSIIKQAIIKVKQKTDTKTLKTDLLQTRIMKNRKKIALSSGIEPISIISAFTGNYPDGYRFSGEMHDFWEIVLVRHGSLWVAEEQKIQNLKKNIHKILKIHIIIM